MKNLSNKQIILIKKCVAAGCALLCMILMLFNILSYTSSTEIANSGEHLTWKDDFSVFSFLFNAKVDVLETNISVLRNLFPFSYVIVWVSYIVQTISFYILVYGIFNVKNLFSRIGAISLLSSIGLLLLVSFDVDILGKTIRYLSVFTPFYFIALIISVIGLISVLNIKNKS